MTPLQAANADPFARRATVVLFAMLAMALTSILIKYVRSGELEGWAAI